MGRLLLVDLGEDEDRFEQFMMPLASKYPNSVVHLLRCIVPCLNFTFKKFVTEISVSLGYFSEPEGLIV
jgi:hypothetical protein